MSREERSVTVVSPPDAGESFWQPVPANGWAEVKVSPRDDARVRGFSSGIQVIAPGCHVREHRHGREHELLFFYAGRGRVELNGASHPVSEGAMIFVGPGNAHRIVNEGDGDLRMMWVLMPGGLEDFFEAIGRPRAPGAPPPPPFPRPADVEAIERATVFAPSGD